MSYSIRPFRDDDVEGLLNIVEAVWGAKGTHKFKALHPWFRRRNAAHADRGDDDLVLEASGEVVGYIRLLPCEYIVDGQRIPATYFADNATHPDHRGAGLQLARHVLRTPDVLRIGAPVARFNVLWDRLTRPRRAGIAPIERCVLLLRPSAHLQKRGVPRVLGAVVDLAWRVWLRTSLLLRAPSMHGQRSISSEPQLPAADEYDELFATFAQDFYGIAVRDSGFLRWRFLESCMDYRFLWLRDAGRLTGYMVYRQSVVNGRPLLLIVEAMAIGDKRANYMAMLGRVVAHGLDCGAAEVQTIHSGCIALYAAMKQLGMMGKVEETLLLAHVHSAKPFADELSHRGPWYLSLAESDHEFSMYPFTPSAATA
jgi:hypothetical protein